MTRRDATEQRPLLAGSRSPSPHKLGADYASTGSADEQDIATGSLHPSRSLEDDVLPETSALGRTLTWQSAYIIVISRVIGSGIFATPGAIVRGVGSPGLALACWVGGAGAAAAGLAVALEYGCMLPRSGGHKVYLEFTYPRPRFLASTLYALYAVLLGFTASNCVVFSQYVLFALDVDRPSDALRKAVAVALLVAVTLVHGVTPRLGVRLQNALGWIKIGIVFFMIASGLYVVAVQPTTSATATTTTAKTTATALNSLSWDRLWADSNWNWGVISTALFKVFYSYAGLDNVTNVMNEVRDPVRTLRSVSLTALATACAMYCLVNVAYFLVVPLDELKGSGELIAALFFERVFGGHVGRKLLPLAVALSMVGNVLVVVFAKARLKQEIARQGFLPFSDLLSSTRPFGSPLGGLMVSFIPSILVIVLPPSGEIYSFILEVEGYPAQIIGLATTVGLVWLRFKRPDLRRPFKAWTIAIVLKLVLAVGLIAAPFFPPKEKPASGLFYATYAIVGISILTAGVVYWYIWTVLVPRLRGYRLEEDTKVLKDGTTITKLVHRR